MSWGPHLPAGPRPVQRITHDHGSGTDAPHDSSCIVSLASCSSTTTLCHGMSPFHSYSSVFQIPLGRLSILSERHVSLWKQLQKRTPARRPETRRGLRQYVLLSAAYTCPSRLFLLLRPVMDTIEPSLNFVHSHTLHVRTPPPFWRRTSL